MLPSSSFCNFTHHTSHWKFNKWAAADKVSFPRQKGSVGSLGLLTKLWYLLKVSDVLVNLRAKNIWQKTSEVGAFPRFGICCCQTEAQRKRPERR